MSYDYAVVIGRFQPIHNGHMKLIERALEEAKMVIIVLGSMDEQPSLKNPFSARARVDIIRSAVTQPADERLIFTGVRDYCGDDDLWAKMVKKAVNTWTQPEDKIALIGYTKDASSTYLRWFPRWSYIEGETDYVSSATDIRRLLFAGEHEKWTPLVPPGVAALLMEKYVGSQEYNVLSLAQSFGADVIAYGRASGYVC